MYQRYKERFGTAGVIIGVIALVLALATGAYAAGGGLSGKQKKEVEKIAKKFQGTGPAGAAGAVGPAGAPGTNGTNGSPGAPGKEGPEGKQGKEGKEGKEGTTGFTATLPFEETETGTWNTASVPSQFEAGEFSSAAVSFSIPLAQPIPGAHVFFFGTAGPTTQAQEEACPGTTAAPAAAPGNFCAYTGLENNLTPKKFLSPTLTAAQTGVTGLLLRMEATAEAVGAAFGSWAVTAPPEA